MNVAESQITSYCKEFVGENPFVKKYVFDFKDAIAEVVLYKYPDYETRTVICCSVQCGCPVGCSFCGTGACFKRNLTDSEIIQQVIDVVSFNSIKESKRLQIMFMSMGEPFLNFTNVSKAIKQLNLYFSRNSFDVVDFYISTIAPNTIKEEFSSLIALSNEVPSLGLQFSIHSAYNMERNYLIPWKQKLDLIEISMLAKMWKLLTNKNVRLNYCCTEENTNTEAFNKLSELFDKDCCEFTFSVVCSSDKCVLGEQRMDLTDKAVFEMSKRGFICHSFNPAGQDDIGGGCGQLHYVQEWFKNNRFKNKAKECDK